MKSYRANAGSGLAGLRLSEDPEPEPGPREVLGRVRANSLNFRELLILDGTYPLPVKPDVVMGARRRWRNRGARSGRYSRRDR
jgi:NADPH:quinone reductase-like Zn-dependent oxidoreductase